MKENDNPKPKRPFVYDAKGDVTNMVYDDSGMGIDHWHTPCNPESDVDGDKGPLSETVSTTVPV